MAIIFDKTSLKDGVVNKKWTELDNSRALSQSAPAAVLVPEEVYAQIDSEVKQIILDPTADVLYNDLIGLDQGVAPLGGKIHTSKVRRDDEAGRTDVFAGSDAPTQRGSYEQNHTLILDHSVKFEFGYDEVNAIHDKNYSDLIDETASAVRSIRNRMQNAFVDGGVTAKGVPLQYQNVESFGLRSSNTRAQKVKIGADLTKATGAEAVTAFVNIAYELTSKSRISTPRTFYVSPEIARQLSMPAGADASIGLTTRMLIENLPEVKEIKTSNKLSGNEMLAIVLSKEHIRVLVAQPIAVSPRQRLGARDSFEWDVYAKAGLDIRTDADGHTGVAYIAK